MPRESIFKIKDRISKACLKVKRDPGSITIVAVSKERTAEAVKEVFEEGIINFGENKVQEALLKYNDQQLVACCQQQIKWHMIGHLQTNKARDAVRIFDLIHSVDSFNLALEINKQAEKINKVQDILIEVKTSFEETKFGIIPEELTNIINKLSGLKNIRFCGLMTIAPLADNPEGARPYFRLLRELRDKIQGICPRQLVLSMGMSDDFEVAVEEGSTMVRIGRAIFTN